MFASPQRYRSRWRGAPPPNHDRVNLMHAFPGSVEGGQSILAVGGGSRLWLCVDQVEHPPHPGGRCYSGAGLNFSRSGASGHLTSVRWAPSRQWHTSNAGGGGSADDDDDDGEDGDDARQQQQQHQQQQQAAPFSFSSSSSVSASASPPSPSFSTQNLLGVSLLGGAGGPAVVMMAHIPAAADNIHPLGELHLDRRASCWGLRWGSGSGAGASDPPPCAVLVSGGARPSVITTFSLTGLRVGKLSPAPNDAFEAAFCDDDRTLFYGLRDGRILVYDLRAGGAPNTFGGGGGGGGRDSGGGSRLSIPMELSASVSAIQPCKDGRRVFLADTAGVVGLWDRRFPRGAVTALTTTGSHQEEEEEEEAEEATKGKRKEKGGGSRSSYYHQQGRPRNRGRCNMSRGLARYVGCVDRLSTPCFYGDQAALDRLRIGYGGGGKGSSDSFSRGNGGGAGGVFSSLFQQKALYRQAQACSSPAKRLPVKMDPTEEFAAGADLHGCIRIWSLRRGGAPIRTFRLDRPPAQETDMVPAGAAGSSSSSSSSSSLLLSTGPGDPAGSSLAVSALDWGAIGSGSSLSSSSSSSGVVLPDLWVASPTAGIYCCRGRGWRGRYHAQADSAMAGGED